MKILRIWTKSRRPLRSHKVRLRISVSEAPGKVRKISIKDLPAPFTTKSAGNAPKLVDRPQNAWPKVPAGFKVDQYAAGLNHPPSDLEWPLMATTSVAESDAGDIPSFSRHQGRFQTRAGSGLHQRAESAPMASRSIRPALIPELLYIGNTNSVVRFPARKTVIWKPRGKAEKHTLWTCPLVAAIGRAALSSHLMAKECLWLQGSSSNVDDSDVATAEKNRANILEFSPDGSGMHIYASGIRNPGGGLAINPQDRGIMVLSESSASFGLGDNLVPDYITHVQEGGYYGWPWWYMGGHQDPRHEGKHPELESKVITPDVILQPHNASLQLTFYTGHQFPAEYSGDIFASEHGSWNKSVRAGYELIRVPLHQTARAAGDYEDFLTGFVLDDGNVWGRPVGVAVAQDGSLLVSDDASQFDLANQLYRKNKSEYSTVR